MEQNRAAELTDLVATGINFQCRIYGSKGRTILKPARGTPENNPSSVKGVALNRIKLQSLRNSVFGTDEPLSVGVQVHTHLRISLRQPSPRVCERWIELDDPAQHLDRGTHVELIPVRKPVNRAHVEFKCQRVLGGRYYRLVTLLVLGNENIGNGIGDTVLQTEQVLQVPVVLSGVGCSRVTHAMGVDQH